MAPKLTVDGTKYTFFVPDGDYRPHIHRHGEPWVVIGQGCNAVLALMYEAERAREALSKIETILPTPPSTMRRCTRSYPAIVAASNLPSLW